MLLIDTSVWISVFRDRTAQVRQKLETLINDRDIFLTRFTQLELLQGSLNEKSGRFFPPISKPRITST